MMIIIIISSSCSSSGIISIYDYINEKHFLIG